MERKRNRLEKLADATTTRRRFVQGAVATTAAVGGAAYVKPGLRGLGVPGALAANTPLPPGPPVGNCGRFTLGGVASDVTIAPPGGTTLTSSKNSNVQTELLFADGSVPLTGTLVSTTSSNTLWPSGELHCMCNGSLPKPNTLQIQWVDTNGDRHNFHMDTLTLSLCTSTGQVGPSPPSAGFDTIQGEGTGKYNAPNDGGPGVDAWIQFGFQDLGQADQTANGDYVIELHIGTGLTVGVNTVMQLDNVQITLSGTGFQAHAG